MKCFLVKFDAQRIVKGEKPIFLVGLMRLVYANTYEEAIKKIKTSKEFEALNFFNLTIE